jgi:quercetin dioxygenase-like cupin family protein
LLGALGGSALGALGVVAATTLALRKRRTRSFKNLMHVVPADLTFVEVHPGVSRAIVQGNPEIGPYVAYIRFAPDSRFPLHTHPSDITLTVLSGAYIYAPRDGAEIRALSGSTVVLPAGLAHTSRADEREGALFVEVSPGRFDIKVLD